MTSLRKWLGGIIGGLALSGLFAACGGSSAPVADMGVADLGPDMAKMLLYAQCIPNAGATPNAGNCESGFLCCPEGCPDAGTLDLGGCGSINECAPPSSPGVCPAQGNF